MPQRENAPPGAPCWIDLFTSDPDRSRAFYGALFGWTSEEPNEEFGGYINFLRQGERIAGCMRNDGSTPAHDAWSVYLASDDAKATVDAAEARGGTTIVPAMDVGDLGTMAVVTDCGGAVIGVWQPGTHRGFQVVDENDAAAWFELHTRDHDTSVLFYQDVFGWTTHTMGDTDEFRYTTQVDPAGGDDVWLAGVMDATAFLPEGVPAHWSVYFGVPDTDTALARVVELGGSVLMPAEDTPYGRLAVASDPTGAMFKLRGENAS